MADASNKSVNAVVVVAPMVMHPEFDPRYHCCCGCMHVKIGAIIIGVLDVLSALSMSSVNAWFVVIMTVFSIVIVGLMLYGIHVTNHLLVIPYLVWQGVQLVIFVVMSIIFLAVFIFFGKVATDVRVEVNGRAVDQAEAQKIVDGFAGSLVVLLLFWFGLLFAIHLWFFFVIRRLFEYLKAKRALFSPGVGLATVGVVPGPAVVVPAPPVGVSPPESIGAGPAGATTSASTDPGNGV